MTETAPHYDCLPQHYHSFSKQYILYVWQQIDDGILWSVLHMTKKAHPTTNGSMTCWLNEYKPGMNKHKSTILNDFILQV